MMEQEPAVKEVSGQACEFLKRADLKGNEVEAFSNVWNFMNAIFAGEYRVLSTREYLCLKDSDDEIALMQECINRFPKTVGKTVDKVREEREALKKALPPV